jgi:hypothetical protein
MERPKYEELSQNDKALLKRINHLDDEWGWARWPEISSLADQLENEYYRDLWNNTCKHYNHLEEASIGDI